MRLTDTALRNAKPRTKPFKIFDGHGLFILVTPSGGKHWRYKYEWAGREKLLALGSYPVVGVSVARERHLAARKMLSESLDPSEAKREAKRRIILDAENSFEAIAREFCASRNKKWSEGHSKAAVKRLENHIFPTLGNRPISKITPTEFLSTLRTVEANSPYLAQLLLQFSGRVFRYAVSTGRAERDPLVDLRGALRPPVVKHQAHLKEKELPDYFKRLEKYDGGLLTRLALDLVLLTIVRTGEARGAKIEEFDLDKEEWHIPAERMKMRQPHIVPLSTQAVAVVKEIVTIVGGSSYLFPNQQSHSGYMSENTMLYALYRMGYHSRATVHGFRSTASTILNESGFNRDAIERQLAHAERNTVRASYNYAEYLPERRKMMQWWADHLDILRSKNVA